ncbi:MAG: hypothetical protein Q4A86_01310 [Clostridia bacterium]|nr:hypothetical protein [Clostridia bacterium]
MKRFLVITVVLSSLLLSACFNSRSVGVIGGADSPTSIYVSNENKGFEKRPVRMIKVDGKLYYDSGRISDMTGRCGTLDGNLKRSGKGFEIPQNDGECNFDGAAGYQSTTSITKEIPLDDGWVIFKQFDTTGLDMDKLKYCFYLKGRLPNASEDSEIVVLSESKDVDFKTVTKDLYSSKFNPDETKYETAFVFYDTGDKWGVKLGTKDVSKTGLTLMFEQFGGTPSGELQTGAWYKLETHFNGEWQDVKAKVDNAVWNSIAYGIRKNDITELEVNWEFLYGELPPGLYRISKEIMDFRKSGDFDEKVYQAYFTVEK